MTIILNPFKLVSEVKKYYELKRNNDILKGELNAYKRETSIQSSRPASYDPSYSAAVIPNFPITYGHLLYELSRYSDILTGIHRSLRSEMFRNGVEVFESENMDAETTDSDEADKADLTQKKYILEKLEKINKNGQSVIDLFKSLEDDVNIYDDQWMFLRFSYDIDINGEISKKNFIEALRVDPGSMDFVMDRDDNPGYDEGGFKVMVAPSDRSTVYKNIENHPQTGEKLYPAHFKQMGEKNMYFFEWEMVHSSRYRPSRRRGFPPILSAYMKIRTLMMQDDYMLKLYEGKRPPKGGLFFNTSNMDALEKSWNTAKQRAQENPHLPWIMGVPQGGSGKSFVEFIDFMKNMNDLQYGDQRESFRRELGFLYGVSPVIMNDTSTSGGLNNEGMQYTVMNRVTEDGQSVYNEKFLKAIRNAIEATGWTLKLRPSEEQDEAAKLERLMKSLEIGEKASQLGLIVKFDSNTHEVIINDGQLKYNSPSPLGSFANTGESEQDTPPANTMISGSPPTPNKSIEKSQQSSTSGYTTLSKMLKDEIDKFVYQYKRMPSQKELDVRLKKIKLAMASAMLESTRDFYRKHYDKSVEEVEKELNMNFEFDAIDKEAIEVLSNQKVIYDAFANLNDEVIQKIQDRIISEYNHPNFNIQRLQQDIKEIADVADFRAETIARTETSKVSAAARRNSYKKADPEDNFRYVHIGPDDHRTTPTSKRIKRRTKGGVTWQDYVLIVKEESSKDFPKWTVDDNFPISHYNTRHVFTRIV